MHTHWCRISLFYMSLLVSVCMSYSTNMYKCSQHAYYLHPFNLRETTVTQFTRHLTWDLCSGMQFYTFLKFRFVCLSNVILLNFIVISIFHISSDIWLTVHKWIVALILNILVKFWQNTFLKFDKYLKETDFDNLVVNNKKYNALHCNFSI